MGAVYLGGLKDDRERLGHSFLEALRLNKIFGKLVIHENSLRSDVFRSVRRRRSANLFHIHERTVAMEGR